jgi:phosphatidate cytidylyltransferase
MKKIIQRLLVFLIGIPLIAALVLLLPWRNHCALNTVVVVFTGIGALEFAAMLAKRGLVISKAEAFVLGILAPAAQTAVISWGINPGLVPLVLMAGAFWVCLSRVFSRSEALEGFAGSLAAGMAVLAYPGVFMYWLIRMSAWENAGPVMLVFLMTAIGNDSAAWAAGMLFGRNNRGIIPASPNKSAAGFIGGTFGSIIITAGAALIAPGIFTPRYGAGIAPALWAAAALGFFPGIAAALGDLCESAIKRSCGVKDSGNIMLGRGGILDSIDSIAAAAPVFYLVFSLLFR